MVLWDPKAASLTPFSPIQKNNFKRIVRRVPQHSALFSPAGTPLLKRVPALNTIVCAASAVRSGQVKPARTTSVCRRELSIPLLLASFCRQKMELVARRLRASLASSKLSNVLAVVIHLCCTPVLLLAVRVLDAPVAPLTSLDAGTSVLNLRPLEHLARLQHPALAVLHRDRAHCCRGHTG